MRTQELAWMYCGQFVKEIRSGSDRYDSQYVFHYALLCVICLVLHPGSSCGMPWSFYGDIVKGGVNNNSETPEISAGVEVCMEYGVPMDISPRK